MKNHFKWTGALISGDRAKAVRHSVSNLPPLDVFDDDYDAYIASWEDFYRGGTGRWYDSSRRDIYDLDLLSEECTHHGEQEVP